MAMYEIPRNVKGEGRFLFIFSTKALIYSGIGAGIGVVFLLIFSYLKLTLIGWIFLAILALIGFIIGTFKVPNIDTFKFTRKTGGENIDDVIKRAIMFKQKKNKIYLYVREEKENGNK